MDGTFPEFEHSDSLSTESESVHVALVSVGNGVSEAGHEFVHGRVAALDEADSVSVSVGPHGVVVDSGTVSVVGSLGSLDEPHESVVEGMGDLRPFVEGVSHGEHDLVPVVSLGVGAERSGGVVDHDSVSPGVVSTPGVHLFVGMDRLLIHT